MADAGSTTETVEHRPILTYSVVMDDGVHIECTACRWSRVLGFESSPADAQRLWDDEHDGEVEVSVTRHRVSTIVPEWGTPAAVARIAAAQRDHHVPAQARMTRRRLGTAGAWEVTWRWTVMTPADPDALLGRVARS